MFRPVPQRRCFTYIDGEGERTITTIGERLNPSGEDPLPWEELARTDAVYFTAGDTEVEEAARRAGVVVATPRILHDLARAGVRLDALVGSASDPAEIYRAGDLDPPPRLVVRTEGSDGGTYEMEASDPDATPPPRFPVRSWTRTAAGTASPPASPTPSARVTGSSRRSTWPHDAGRRA